MFVHLCLEVAANGQSYYSLSRKSSTPASVATDLSGCGVLFADGESADEHGLAPLSPSHGLWKELHDPPAAPASAS